MLPCLIFFKSQIHRPFKKVVEKSNYNICSHSVNRGLSQFLVPPPRGLCFCFFSLKISCGFLDISNLCLGWVPLFPIISSPEPWFQAFTCFVTVAKASLDIKDLQNTVSKKETNVHLLELFLLLYNKPISSLEQFQPHRK